MDLLRAYGVVWVFGAYGIGLANFDNYRCYNKSLLMNLHYGSLWPVLAYKHYFTDQKYHHINCYPYKIELSSGRYYQV